MSSVHLGRHLCHTSGFVGLSRPSPRSCRSLTSLQAWHLDRALRFRPRHCKVCGNKRGRDSFFKDDFFQDGKDSLNDAKQLFAQGEKMFKNGQFQKGQQLFQQAEQQLRQARQQTPIQPFKSSSTDFKAPKIQFGDTSLPWKSSTLALFGVGAVATLVAGPIIATFLALAVGLGALSTSIAIFSVAWIIPVAAVVLSLGGLFVFPVALTLGLTATGLGIGAAAVAAFRNIIPKQTARTYPEAAEAIAQEPVPETEEQRQRRQYEEESENLANELREFDAQLEVKEKDAYRDKLKREGLWKD